MQITAALVKELRERTGSGMMECKKALVDAGGDIDAALEVMRKSGQAKADKKAGRVAAEGMVAVAVEGNTAAVVEVNSETDFVAKEEGFRTFAQQVAEQVLAQRPAALEDLMALTLPATGSDVETARRDLIAKIGENINVRRFTVIAGEGDRLGVYLHGARIAVVVDLKGGDDALAKDLAMHIAASRPVCVAEGDVPAEMVEKEKEIFAAQAAESGKPPEIVEKMITGRLKKYMKEVTLLGQPFVKDPDTPVEKLLAERGAQVLGFERIEVGEGIEKKSENFAEEVMAQVAGQ